MKIETIIRITDDDGNVIERRQLEDAGIPAIDTFNDKEKFLDQFDAAEKALIRANNEASTQVLGAYCDEAVKKKATAGAEVKIRMLDAEIGRFAVPVWGELEDGLQPKERLYSYSIMGLLMSFISVVSDRKALCPMNRVLHRSIDDGEDDNTLRLRTMTDLCERTGRQISACSRALGARALKEHGFSAETGLPLPGAQLSPAITHPDADMLPISDVVNAAKQLQEKGSWIPPQVLGDKYEDPVMSCYIAIDDIGVKKQNEHRKDSMAVSKKRATVEHTVVKVMSEEDEHILTGIGMANVVQTLLGFLLHNQLLTNQSLIFLTDGAKNIRNNIKIFLLSVPGALFWTGTISRRSAGNT